MSDLRTEQAARLVLIIAVVSTVTVLSFSFVMSDDGPGIETRGDLTVSGSMASDGIVIDEYGGVGTLTYTRGGDIEWRLKDLQGTAYVKVDGGYQPRGFDDVREGSTLTLSEPGRYEVRMYIDGNLARTGAVTLDGTVRNTYEWTQTASDGRDHTYSVFLEYSFSDYLSYADSDAVRHQDPGLEDSRFAVVDPTVEAMERALRSEYERVRQPVQYDTQAYADYLLSFAQSCIEYPDLIGEGTHSDTLVYGESEYWAYPLETIHFGMGDCEDTSFLSAALFASAGYGAAVLALEGHMVSAVALDMFTPPFDDPDLRLTVKHHIATGMNLYFCETTDVHWPVGYLDPETHAEVVAADRVSPVAVSS